MLKRMFCGVSGTSKKEDVLDLIVPGESTQQLRAWTKVYGSKYHGGGESRSRSKQDPSTSIDTQTSSTNSKKFGVSHKRNTETSGSSDRFECHLLTGRKYEGSTAKKDCGVKTTSDLGPNTHLLETELGTGVHAMKKSL